MSGARITDAFTLGRMTHRDTPPSERPIPPPSLLLPAWCSHLGLDYVECMGGDPEARNAKSQVALRGRRAWEGCVSFAFFRVSWNSSSSSLPLGSVLPEGRACVVDATLPLVRWSNPPPPDSSPSLRKALPLVSRRGTPHLPRPRSSPRSCRSWATSRRTTSAITPTSASRPSCSATTKGAGTLRPLWIRGCCVCRICSEFN